MFKQMTLLLCLLPCNLMADSSTASSASSSSITPVTDASVNLTLSNIFYRTTGSPYLTNTTQTHFMSDLFDFYKYNALREEEKEAFHFYQNPPSRDNFSTLTMSARANYMFQPPFSNYDTLNPSQTIQNDYIYTKKLFFYDEFLKRAYIDANDVTANYGPTDTEHLPRGGVGYNAAGAYNELTHTSGIQSMLFKHFYQYCPNNYTSVCQTILENTGISGWSTTGISTFNPDGDINAESLLAESNMVPETIPHHAARDYIQTLSDPWPTNIVPFKVDPNGTGDYVPDTSNLQTIAQNIVDRSYRSLGQYVLNSIKNRRAASSQPSGTAGGSSSNQSILQFLDSMSTQRINSTNDWMAMLNTTSTEGLLREIAIIESSRLLLDYMQFRQNEHIEALLAANVIQNQNLIQAIQVQVNPAATQSAVAATLPK